MNNELKPLFLETPNVQNFGVMMKALSADAGRGRLACVWGQAGRGKTETAIHYHAAHASIFMRAKIVWTKRSMLRDLCRELQVNATPRTASDAFDAAVDCLRAELAAHPGYVLFIDEIERLPKDFMEICRDLTDLSGVPIVLIGEEELPVLMRSMRRIWSRTPEAMEFKPLDAAVVVAAARSWGGFKLEIGVAADIWAATGGDMRTLRNILGSMLMLLAADKAETASKELAGRAIRLGLRELPQPRKRGQGVAS